MIPHAIYFIIFSSLFYYQCESQVNRPLIGGPCQGCEAATEYGTKALQSTDTIPGFLEEEPKIKIFGTVYEKDGKTPASGVILYVYQTNRSGIYYTRGDEEGWGRRHGIHRTWIKTDKNGHYSFYTFRPGAYPSRSEPEHIHLTIKEEDKNPYYASDYHFDDDPLLTTARRTRLNKRTGQGVIRLNQDGDILTARRDIILGLNIPDYW